MLFRDLEMKLIARRTLSQSFIRFGGYQGNSLHSKGKVTYNAHDVNHGDGVPPSWEQLMGSGNQYFYFHNHVSGWFPAAANTTYEAELGICQKTVSFDQFSLILVHKIDELSWYISRIRFLTWYKLVSQRKWVGMLKHQSGVKEDI